MDGELEVGILLEGKPDDGAELLGLEELGGDEGFDDDGLELVGKFELGRKVKYADGLGRKLTTDGDGNTQDLILHFEQIPQFALMALI